MCKQQKVIKEGNDKYTSNTSGILGVDTMVTTTKSGLSIAFQNPNTPEEIAKLLIGIVAKSMFNKTESKDKKQT